MEKEELETKLALKEQAAVEREISDQRYAIKLVEKIVFYAVGAIALAVLSAVIATVIKTST